MAKTPHAQPFLLLALLASIGLGVACRQNGGFDARSDPENLSAAETEVYETVVRDMVQAQPSEGQTEIGGLVFNKSVETTLCPGAESKWCDEGLRARVTTTLAGQLDPDAVEDFITKSRNEGSLSTKFHTDLPRVFIDMAILFRNRDSIESSELRDLEKNLRAAGGVISLSDVGFDRTLHQAIATSSFYCGSLCGFGRRYVLKKRWGEWVVVKSWTVWVS